MEGRKKPGKGEGRKKGENKGQEVGGGLRFYIVISEAHLSHSISPFLR